MAVSVANPDNRMSDRSNASQGAEILDASDVEDYPAPEMFYTHPMYTLEQVDAAGRALLDLPLKNPEYTEVTSVVNNWRRSHSFPQNTFWVTLNRYAREIHSESVVAQRTKRLQSIKAKLQRFKWRNLTLSEMQDLGGCRAIMPTVAAAIGLGERYRSSSRIKHKLLDQDDYVAQPKPSGYRGIHLIYGYHSDRKTTYNGLKIEVQIRSVRMHAWATAVETVDTFTRQSIKTGEGEDDWRRFFALMSAHFAMLEETAIVPRTPTDTSVLRRELGVLAHKLNVVNRLTAYGEALETHRTRTAPRDAHYYVLNLDPSDNAVRIWSFSKEEVQQAETVTEALEATGHDAVLVSVESVDALHRAYPNYFLDTRTFLEAVREVVE